MENKTAQKTSEPEISFWRFCARVYAIYKPFRGVLFLVFAMILAAEAISLINPYIYGKIVDGIMSGKPMASVVTLLFIALGISLTRNFLDYSRGIVEIKKLNYKINRLVTERTLEKLLDFSIGQHENQNSGIKKSIIDRGHHSLEALAQAVIYEIAPVVLRVSAVVTALLVLAPVLGAMVFAGFAVLVGLTFYLNVVFREGLKKIRDDWHEVDKKHSEILRNVALVKINAKESEIIGELDAVMAAVGDFAARHWTRFASWALSRGVLLQLLRFSVMLVGAYFVYEGIYTAGFLIVTVWSWSNSVFSDFGRISGMHRRLMEQAAAIKKYFILMDIESDVKEAENPLKPEKFAGKIEFKNVYFKYPKREYIHKEKQSPDKSESKKEKKRSDEYVLKNINFTVEPGQKVAIVGPSGVGKTSMAHLLIRASDPQKGRILIDGNDLKEISLESFRSAVGMVPQDVSLFDNTLRYNIAFGIREGEVSEERLWRAAKMACVDKFIAKLERGFDTIIGERGIRLSGGERQRVGIARALIKNPPFLIFDEATSSLDTENEALIRASIGKASKGRTTVIIAHRLSTVKDADKIIVMEGGKIVGEGGHEELLKTCKIYQRLINNQTVMVDSA